MAYMVVLSNICSDKHCTKQATHQVFANLNMPVGRYCKRHAEAWVKTLTDAERLARGQQQYGHGESA